jgi:hypothetical protein
MPALSTVQCGKQKGLMSALGQQRTWRLQLAMSALPPKADSRTYAPNVRFGQKQTHALQQRKLFDHLVGDLLEMHRHVEA